MARGGMIFLILIPMSNAGCVEKNIVMGVFMMAIKIVPSRLMAL